ncbi:MAG: glycosyltransferase [Candidatus Omnitrophica bacterium]|nr:glycosyltransferase [Candidatus Omnitrophota bacterium]
MSSYTDEKPGSGITKDERVDVIITTYNGEKHILQLLDSLAKQSFQNFNYIIIDDHSIDRTVRVIRDRFPGVKVIEQSRNRGPAYNRNIAARMGNSAYLVFLDDDVILKDQDWIKKGIAYLQGDPKIGQIATMVVSGFDSDIILDCGIKGEGPTFAGAFYKKHQDLVLNNHKISGKVLGACSAGTVIRRNIFELIGGFDAKYYYISEDLDLSIRVHLTGYDVVYLPDMITYHLESQAMSKRAREKRYLYFRNNFFVLLEHYPLSHILNKIFRWQNFYFFRSEFWLRAKKFFQKRPIVFDERVRKEVNSKSWKIFVFFRMSASIFFNFPRIMFKRWRVDCFRKRPRRYLLELNKEMEDRLALSLPVKSLVFQITNKCNATCKMCFLRQELNKPAKFLTLEEIRLFTVSLSDVNNVVLGGGEPFLREDIDKICRCFIDNRSDVCITIPTNGYDPRRIYEKVKGILAYGSRDLIISLSLDGMEEYHDQNRGVEGLFKKVHQSYEELEKLCFFYPEVLQIQVNTCVTKKNIDQLGKLAAFIHDFMPKAKWFLEPVRGSSDPNENEALSFDEWRLLKESLGKLLIQHPPSRRNILSTLFEYSLKALQNQSQPVPCRAGNEFIAIDYCGNISSCEILPYSGINIRQLDYNINHLLAYEEWKRILRSIKRGECYCTHFCWLSYSLMVTGRL